MINLIENVGKSCYTAIPNEAPQVGCLLDDNFDYVVSEQKGCT